MFREKNPGNTACMANLYRGPKNAHDLLIDSGATTHIICNKDLLHEGTFRSENCCLETGSGEVLPIEGKGSLLVSLDNGNGGVTDLILTNVLFSPDLKFNLICTIQPGKKGISTYLMADDKPAQLVHKGKVVGLAKTINNQYVLQTNTISPTEAWALTTANGTKAPIQTWHERLDHLSYPTLLKSNHLAKSVTIINRTPRTRATEFLGIVHSDLGGSFPLTRFGERFYATMKDYFSGVVWISLLKTNGQTFECFKQFKIWIENQSGRK